MFNQVDYLPQVCPLFFEEKRIGGYLLRNLENAIFYEQDAKLFARTKDS